MILKDPEYRDIQRAARSRHMSLAEWVRQALDLARRGEPQGAVGKKLGVIRAAARLDFPTADIDRMLAEQQGTELAGRLTRIGKDCAAHLKEPFRSADHGELRYDEKGLPK